MPTLLTLGVDSYQGIQYGRPFDLGGLGTMISERPFDVLSPLTKNVSNRPFDVQGTVGKTSDRPFDLGVTGLLLTSRRPFDVIDATDGTALYPIVHTTPVVNPVNAQQVIFVEATAGTFTITFDGQTTTPLAWNASPATVQAALEALSNIAPGDVVVGAGSYVVTFGGAYAAMPVAPMTVSTASLTGAATVIVRRPGLSSGTTVDLPGIQIYDKRGVRLGALLSFSVTTPPTRGVSYRGSFGFHVPRVLVDAETGALYPNPDCALLPDDNFVKGDRLVVFGNSMQADDPWGGVMTNVEWTDGSVIVQCADVMDLFSTVSLPEDDELRATQAIIVPEDTNTSNLVSLLVSTANTWFGAHGEVLWGIEATAVDSPFFGYEQLSGDLLSALDTIVQRSFAEWAWRIIVTPTSMRPVLLWQDSFEGGTGPALTDGPDGNVVASPSLGVDLTTPVNAIRIVGSVTKVESQIPVGATALPYQELIPVAEVWLPTNGYRRRFNSSSAGVLVEVEVPFTFEQGTQDALAAAEEAKRQELFRTFIQGFHAQFGRPWHDGWAWSGGAGSYDDPNAQPEDFERTLTEDKWEHYRALAIDGTTTVGSDVQSDEPVAIVMMGIDGGRPAKPGSAGSSSTMTYTVKSGDTLWAIAKRFYGNPLKWPELYRLNKAVIDRTARAHGFTSNFSHWIFPGEKLQVPRAKGSSGSTTGSKGTAAVAGTKGKYVTVFYDRVNAIQRVVTDASVVEVPDDTIFAFEWRRYRQGEWDPSSDGVGRPLPYQTVKGGVLVDESWRVVPYGDGQSASTSLAFGITASATQIPVADVFVLPTSFPYVITVGTDEKMLVASANLSVLTVTRGYQNTTASIHEAGEAVEFKAADQPEEEPVPEEAPPPALIPWPAGEAYARRLLAKLSRPKRKVAVRLANVGGDWSGVALGSQHAIDVQTEGPAGGIVGTVRVLGFAPDYVAGSMELVVEDVW